MHPPRPNRGNNFKTNKIIKMKAFIGAVLGFIVFNLFMGYLVWDIIWFTQLKNYSVSDRSGIALGLFLFVFIGSAIGFTNE